MSQRADMMTYHDFPVAIFIGRGGDEHIRRVSDPPPRFYEVAILPKLELSPDPNPPQHIEIARRVFRLSADLVSAEHRWYRVYNAGRSRTPEQARVYLEVSHATIEPTEFRGEKGR